MCSYEYLPYLIVKNIMKTIRPVILSYLFVLNVLFCSGCPHESKDVKAAYKSGEILDQSPVITLDSIKRKLKETGVIDFDDNTLTSRERKELTKLFDAVEIMTTSRNRQPASAQNVFSSLRLVERAAKKQQREGQMSESLAAKFNWDRIRFKSTRHRRNNPTYYLDKKTNMRIFNTN